MKLDTFTNTLQNCTRINQVETVELKKIIEEYPYFQSARALYLKGLKNQESFKYNYELKQTAAYTTDRSILFDFITSEKFNSTEEDIHQQISEKIHKERKEANPVKEIFKSTKKASIQETTIIEAKKELELGTPLLFSSEENYSFSEWLQLSNKKPIDRSQETNVSQEKKEAIITKFIENNPKIKPVNKDKIITTSIAKNEQDTSLMTQTLAKVYLEQNKYENAIQAYRILSLKYPEKSGFFADQIKRIQILQKNKS
ncbi:hypothetical protein [uncultured Polaribacter sp.]|uniref:hypothetical protein n=1 Tax=uncultured Polaribacter sp. TaxID=174711 RepID=UPI002635D11E|nr:hypothetical protein [uncultured Polaribacter sp.]